MSALRRVSYFGVHGEIHKPKSAAMSVQPSPTCDMPTTLLESDNPTHCLGPCPFLRAAKRKRSKGSFPLVRSRQVSLLKGALEVDNLLEAR